MLYSMENLSIYIRYILYEIRYIYNMKIHFFDIFFNV